MKKKRGKAQIKSDEKGDITTHTTKHNESYKNTMSNYIILKTGKTYKKRINY
jgi:hypothetical protein